jgi:adenylosuccinate synthase
MEVKIVLGHAFGDEGKGVTVQWLCKEAIVQGKKPIVVRFSGGAQAAHTIVNNGVEHICSSFGSGVLLGVPTTYTREFYFDPICFMNEYRALKSKGIKPIYMLPEECRVVTPIDVFAGIKDAKVRHDGTCGKGIYKTFARYEGEDYYTEPSEEDACDIYDEAQTFYGEAPTDADYRKMFCDDWEEAIANNTKLDMSKFDMLIFEGSQGLLLDMNCGFWPHVTPAHTGLAGISMPESFLPGAEIYLVTRTYLTRHGNGYEPKYEHCLDLSKKHETCVDNEFQGAFKTGALETPLLNLAWQRHCMDNWVKRYNMTVNLVVTHLDAVLPDAKRRGFYYVGRVGGYRSRVVETYRSVCKHIKDNLDYLPNRVYYNDSVESNIKRVI